MRRDGDADERWKRLSIPLSALGEGRASVPSGKYKLGGPFGYLVDGDAADTVVVPDGGQVSVLADVRADALGSLELTVASVSGTRLSDYYFRLVPQDAYARGADNPTKQGWIGGEPPERGPDVAAGWIAAREYVLVVTKRGWTQHVGQVSIRGGETTVHAVELEEE